MLAEQPYAGSAGADLVFALLLRGVWGYATGLGMILGPAVVAALLVMLAVAVLINIGLAVFNMIPAYPLDGFHVTLQLLKGQTRQRFAALAPFGIYIIVGLIVGITGALLLAHFMSRPIRTLSHAVEKVGKGELGQRVNIRTKDELEGLSKEFNKMALRLKELDQMKNDFVSSITHELRSPLAAIDSYLNRLLSKEFSRIQQIEYINIMKNNVLRLSRFIDNLLETARIESGKLHLTFKETNFNDLIDEVIMLFKSQADEKQLMMIKEVPTNLPLVLADSDRILQVVTNLISNAIKYTPDGGTVTLNVQRITSNNSLQVSVSDNGHGIMEKDLERIFNKFERVEGGKGVGLGLSIVKGIVEAHGGRVWVESKEGAGSTFCFTLPL